MVGAPTHFTIETFSAGKGRVEAYLQTPDGQVETVSVLGGRGRWRNEGERRGKGKG